MWAFLLQIPHIETNGFQYWLYTTASITAFIRTDGNIGATGAWGTSFQLFVGGEVDPTTIGVNLVAVFALYTLYRASSSDLANAPTPPAPVSSDSSAG